MRTDIRHAYQVATNLLARPCVVEKPNQVWVGDITSVWTAEGWLYLGVLLDVYSRRVVGGDESAHGCSLFYLTITVLGGRL